MTPASNYRLEYWEDITPAIGILSIFQACEKERNLV